MGVLVRPVDHANPAAHEADSVGKCHFVAAGGHEALRHDAIAHALRDHASGSAAAGDDDLGGDAFEGARQVHVLDLRHRAVVLLVGGAPDLQESGEGLPRCSAAFDRCTARRRGSAWRARSWGRGSSGRPRAAGQAAGRCTADGSAGSCGPGGARSCGHGHAWSCGHGRAWNCSHSCARSYGHGHGHSRSLRVCSLARSRDRDGAGARRRAWACNCLFARQP
mmetsp:Transcript_56778/g.182394  ORF Transcript_56778/g.182394 Transcript_56778/m.182394 type:complete len:222 (+) Transcript_56778:1396-2061(+)